MTLRLAGSRLATPGIAGNGFDQIELPGHRIDHTKNELRMGSRALAPGRSAFQQSGGRRSGDRHRIRRLAIGPGFCSRFSRRRLSRRRHLRCRRLRRGCLRGAWLRSSFLFRRRPNGGFLDCFLGSFLCCFLGDSRCSRWLRHSELCRCGLLRPLRGTLSNTRIDHRRSDGVLALLDASQLARFSRIDSGDLGRRRVIT